MIEEIYKLYGKLNAEMLLVSPDGPQNDQEFRYALMQRIDHNLSTCTVICDERNNPPAVINARCVAVNITWREDHKIKYCNLVFGRPEVNRTIHEMYFVE